MNRSTVFSPCRKYRYTLWREWDCGLPISIDPTPSAQRPENQYVQFIGLNPSTADETKNDPTVTRCINYAKSWGFGAYCMTNIFAWRDTLPENMKSQGEPIGPDNDKWLVEIAKCAGLVVAAWGNHGVYLNRFAQVQDLLKGFCDLKCFKITSTGQPIHPLYQKSNAVLIDYKPAQSDAVREVDGMNNLNQNK